MDAWKKALAACIPDGTPLPILSGPLRGRRWLAGAAPGPAKGLSTLFNRCEPGQLRAAEHLARLVPDGICFDIGAHSGLYTLLLARNSRLVYAFEPLPRNLAYLVRTLAVNGIANAHVIPWAVGGQTRLDGFQVGEHSSEGRVEAAGTMPAFTVTCDEFSVRYRAVPTLLKIDVEGTELEVLKGAVGILRAGSPAILLSTHGDGPKHDCLHFLRNLGYRNVRPLDGPGEESAREFSITA
jgi:FkbM family methyltransferase